MTVRDVIVVGAGVAGLACARDIAGAGGSVLVLEAGHRIGGRVRTLQSAPGESWELGAQVVHGADNPVWALLPGQAAADSYRDSEFRVLLGAVSRPMAALAGLALPPWGLAAAIRTRSGTGSMAAVLGGWSLDPVSRAVADRWLEQDWAAPVGELDSTELVGVAAGRRESADQLLPAGGLSTLTDELAKGLDIRLDSPVSRISHDGRVSVATGHVPGGSITYRADAVVITAPPWTIDRGALHSNALHIDVLTAGKRHALQVLRGGDAVVAVISTDRVSPTDLSVFDADGGHGFLRSRAGSTRVQIVGKGAGAARLRGVLRSPGRLEALLAAAMPWAAGARVTGVDLADWGSESFVGGAFTVPGPGSAQARLEWARPTGRLFFAGEATCGADGVARVHGALASGQRAAAEINGAKTAGGGMDSRRAAAEINGAEIGGTAEVLVSSGRATREWSGS